MLRVRAPERIGLVELILAEAEARGQDGGATGCGLLQARLPLLLSCCHGDDEGVGEVTAHLTSCIQQWGNRYGRCVPAGARPVPWRGDQRLPLRCGRGWAPVGRRGALALLALCVSAGATQIALAPAPRPGRPSSHTRLFQCAGPALPRPACAAVPAAAGAPGARPRGPAARRGRHHQQHLQGEARPGAARGASDLPTFAPERETQTRKRRNASSQT